MLRYGDALEHGKGGVPRDLAAALTWFKRASDAGDPKGKLEYERLKGIVTPNMKIAAAHDRDWARSVLGLHS